MNDHAVTTFFTNEVQKKKLEILNLNAEKARYVEKQIIEKIANRIKVLDDNGNISIKKMVKLGSLCSLYNSEYFNIDMLIYDLEDKKESISICNYLINQLQEKHTDQVCFYVPQFFAMSLYHNNRDYLKNFMLDMCINQIKFSIRLHWISSAFLEDNNNIDIEIFTNNIEETLVKNKRTNKRKFIQEKMSTFNIPNLSKTSNKQLFKQETISEDKNALSRLFYYKFSI